MKGFKIGKVAKVVAGAAMVASLVAPAMAQVTLTKDDVLGEDGKPKFKGIVVGANAQPSDYILAAKVALKLAALSKVPSATVEPTAEVSGEASVNNVKLKVGATTTVEGSYVDRSNMDSSSTTPEFNGKTVDHSTVEALQYWGSKNYTYNGTSYTTTMQEKVQYTVNTMMDTDDVKDLGAEITSGGLKYVVDLGTGIPSVEESGSTSAFVDDSDDDVRIPFLGKSYLVYKVDEDSKEVQLLEGASSEEWIDEGGIVEDVKGKDGKMYKIKFVSGYEGDSGKMARLALLDENGNVIKEESFGSDSDVQFYDESGEEILEDIVHLKEVIKKTINNSEVYQIRILTGKAWLRIKDGEGFPYDPNKEDEEYRWKARLYFDSTNHKLTKIEIYNNTYNDFTGEEKLRAGEEAEFANGMKLKFLGLQLPEFASKGVSDPKQVTVFKIESDGIKDGSVIYYQDSDAVSHEIDTVYVWDAVGRSTSEGAEVEKIEMDGGDKEYYIGWTSLEKDDDDTNSDEGAVDGENDLVAVVIGTDKEEVKACLKSIDANDNSASWDCSGLQVGVASPASEGNFIKEYVDSDSDGYVVPGSAKNFTLYGRNNISYTYGVKVMGSTVDASTRRIWVVMKIGVNYSMRYGKTWSLFAISYDDGSVPSGASGQDRFYYAVDDSDFNPNYSHTDDDIIGAIFKIDTDGDSTYDLTAYVDTYTGKLIVGKDRDDDMSWSYAVEDTYNSANNGYVYEGEEDKLAVGYSDYGTKIDTTDDVLTVTIPEERAKAEVMIYGEGETVIEGGEEVELKPGETVTTESGVILTLDSVDLGEITATCTPSKIEVGAQPVDLLKEGFGVYMDTEGVSGPVIVIGGHLVNSYSPTEDKLVAEGDKVMEIINGNLVLAGYTAEDTKEVVDSFIDWLDSLE